MNTYLSIDLDFWEEDRDYKHLRRFLKKVKETCTDIKIVDSHESMTRHINRAGKLYGCCRVINVDYHADIGDAADGAADGFNCGSWAHFINFRKEGEFIWLRPQADESEGCCWHGSRNPFNVIGVSGWKSCKRFVTKTPKRRIDWSSVKAVGIAFSYYWLGLHEDDQIAIEAGKVLGVSPKVNASAKIA